MPKISVIVPIYNCSEYIKRCIDSVLEQTFIDLELICIDDGSTDASYEIASSYKKSDGRVFCYRNERNQGLSYTRNVGLSKAEGEYIIFLDSDDWLVKDAVRLAYEYAGKNGLDILYFNFHSVYENDKAKDKCQIISEDRENMYPVCDGEKLFLEMMDSGDYRSMVPLAMYKKDFLRNEKIFFYNGIMHEDELFTYQAILSAKKVSYLPEKLYIYYRRNGSIMNNDENLIKRLRSDVVIYYEMISFKNERSLRIESIERINMLLYNTYMRICILYADILAKFPNRCEMDFPDIKYKIMWDALRNTMLGSVKIIGNEDLIRVLKQTERLIIYGAGNIARAIVNGLEICGIDKFDVAVSKNEKNKYLLGNKVHEITELAKYKNNACVIVATAKKHHQEIGKKLKEIGFFSVVYI